MSNYADESLCPASSLIFNSPSEKVSSRIDFSSYRQLSLYDPNYYSNFCPKTATSVFESCTGPLKELKIYTGLDIEETTEQSTMKYTILNDPTSLNSSIISRFTGHLFAIPNAYVNRWGQTFDPVEKIRYLSGRCADLPTKPIYPIESLYQSDKCLEFNHIVINLVIPWSFVYGHELMEIIGILMILKPFLDKCQKITLIGFHSLTHTKLFPLLSAAGIDPHLVKFVSIYQKEVSVHASWVIVPIFPCLFIPQAYITGLRKALNNLPYPTNYTGNNIVFHDRRHQHPHRDVPEGKEIEAALRQRYGSSRQVTMIYGSETLEKTIKLMREASVLISVHGSATANMIFMRPDTTYIEISPRFYDFDCMLAMAYALGMKAYDYEAMSGKWQSSAHVNTSNFLPKIYNIIDEQDQHYSSLKRRNKLR